MPSWSKIKKDAKLHRGSGGGQRTVVSREEDIRVMVMSQ